MRTIGRGLVVWVFCASLAFASAARSADLKFTVLPPDPDVTDPVTLYVEWEGLREPHTNWELKFQFNNEGQWRDLPVTDAWGKPVPKADGALQTYVCHREPCRLVVALHTPRAVTHEFRVALHDRSKPDSGWVFGEKTNQKVTWSQKGPKPRLSLTLTVEGKSCTVNWSKAGDPEACREVSPTDGPANAKVPSVQIRADGSSAPFTVRATWSGYQATSYAWKVAMLHGSTLKKECYVGAADSCEFTAPSRAPGTYSGDSIGHDGIQVSIAWDAGVKNQTPGSPYINPANLVSLNSILGVDYRKR